MAVRWFGGTKTVLELNEIKEYRESQPKKHWC